MRRWRRWSRSPSDTTARVPEPQQPSAPPEDGPSRGRWPSPLVRPRSRRRPRARLWLTVGRDVPSPGPVPSRPGRGEPHQAPAARDGHGRSGTRATPPTRRRRPTPREEAARTRPSGSPTRPSFRRLAIARSGPTPGPVTRPRVPRRDHPSRSQPAAHRRQADVRHRHGTPPARPTRRDADPGESTPAADTAPVRRLSPPGPVTRNWCRRRLRTLGTGVHRTRRPRVDEVQPGTEAVIEKAFRDLRRVSITLSGCRITVQSPEASAACTEQTSAVRRSATADRSPGVAVRPRQGLRHLAHHGHAHRALTP